MTLTPAPFDPASAFSLVEKDTRQIHHHRGINVVFETPERHKMLAGSVCQFSDEAGAFPCPPMLRFTDPPSFTRAQWETFKRSVDAAFDAFEGRWPSR